MLLEARHPRVVRPSSVGGTPDPHRVALAALAASIAAAAALAAVDAAATAAFDATDAAHGAARAVTTSAATAATITAVATTASAALRAAVWLIGPPAPPPDHLPPRGTIDDYFEEATVGLRSFRMRMSPVLSRPNAPLITSYLLPLTSQ